MGKTIGELEDWDKAKKKDLTEKSPEEDKGQDLASKTEGDRCKPSSDRMRLLYLLSQNLKGYDKN